MVVGLLCPIAIGAVAALGLPWGLVLAAAFVPLALASLDLPAGHGRVAAKATPPASGRLPRGFWVAWGLAAASVAMESSVIFWGSTLVALDGGGHPDGDAPLRPGGGGRRPVAAVGPDLAAVAADPAAAGAPATRQGSSGTTRRNLPSRPS